MKGKGLKRLLSVFLTAAIMVSMLAVTAVTASAKELTQQDIENGFYDHEIIIKNVTRKNKLAMDICNEINSRRAANGLAKLDADNTLFEESMERAAQLSIYYNSADLVGNDYQTDVNDGSRLETIAFASYRFDGTTTVSSIVENLEDNSVYTSDNTTQRIGVGAVFVDSNPYGENVGERLFVCVRASVGIASEPDTDKYEEDSELVNQGTSINHNLFTKTFTQPMIYDMDAESDNYKMITDDLELQEGRNYQLLFMLQEKEVGNRTKAYIMPKVKNGINEEEAVLGVDYQPSALNYTTITASKSFRVIESNPTVTMTIPGDVAYTYDVALKCDVQEHQPTFTADDIELEWDEGIYYTDTSKNKPAVISVKDHYTGQVLTEGVDYKVSLYYGFGTFLDNVDHITPYVRVLGQGDYTSVGGVKKYYTLYREATDYSVSLEKTTGNSTGERVVVEAYATGGSIYTFTCKDPDDEEVSGTVATGTQENNRFIFTPEKPGKYTVSVSATLTSGETTKFAQSEIEIEILGALTATVSASNDNPDVGETITLTVDARGGTGAGTYTYSFIAGGVVIPNEENSNVVEFTPTKAGSQTILVNVMDGNGKFVYPEVTITAKAAEEKCTVKGLSLTLEGEIGVNIYAKLIDPSYKAVLNGPKGKIEVAYNDSLITQGDNTGLNKFSYFVAASDYDKDITFQILDANDDPVELHNSLNERLENDTYVTKVSNYLSEASRSGNDEDLKKLCNDMYTYAAYADKYFNGDALPDDVDTTGLEAVTAADLANYKSKKSGTAPEGVQILGYTLLLEEKTSLRMYYKYTGSEPAVTVKGEAAEPGTNGKGHYVTLPNVVAKDLGTDATFVVSDGTDSITLTISPLTYAYLVLNAYSNSNNEKEQDLCNTMRALYLYNRSAQACLG